MKKKQDYSHRSRNYQEMSDCDWEAKGYPGVADTGYERHRHAVGDVGNQTRSREIRKGARDVSKVRRKLR